MTTLRIVTIAAVMALAPSLSLAMCNGAKHQQQAQSCIAGTTWDAGKSACVPLVSS